MRLPASRRSRAVMALAAAFAATALAAATPGLAGPLHHPEPAAGPSSLAQLAPVPSSSTGPVELTAVPDTVQSSWLYAFAGQITASRTDTDTDTGTDQCVRHDSVYGDSSGMQPQRQTIVLHADTSVHLTTWKRPTISYRRFETMTVWEIDFSRGKVTRDHAAAGEFAFVIGYQLPVTEAELMRGLLGFSGAVPPQTQPSITAISAFTTLTEISFLQVPPLATRAAILRLIARLPGARITQQAQDPLLRLTVAVTMPEDDVAGNGAENTAYFDPATGELVAYTQLVHSGYTPRSARLPWDREISLLSHGCHHPAAQKRPKASGDARSRQRNADGTP